MKRFNPSHPIVLGLCGKAGSGKTSVADRLAPPAVWVDPKSPFIWDHLYFAMPLYELAAIRRKIQGEHRNDRVLFETHEVLFDLFGRSPLYGLAPYDEFIEIVHKVAEAPIVMDEDQKPRSYLQEVGQFCRTVDPDCFVKNINRLMTRKYMQYAEAEQTEDHIYVCVVSDVRQANEAEWVATQPNGVLVQFDASDEVRAERILNRDGRAMTPEQLAHTTEDVAKIKPWINLTIHTDELTIQEQTDLTKQQLMELLGLEVYA